MTTGLVVGKMYPPHKGHHFLINTALAQCDEVTVLICDSKRYPAIPAELRAQWLREVHPNANVQIIDQDNMGVADEDSEGWAKWTLEYLGHSIDKVYTSEDYGAAYAKFLGAENVRLDGSRGAIPVSGSLVRSDPLKYLDFLEPCVRAFFVKKVCIVGAESTGKTTLANMLATGYETVMVPEFGRYYAQMHHWDNVEKEETKDTWETIDFWNIAQEQNKIEDRYARIANKVLILDTDAWVTKLWEERYLGESKALFDIREHDLYILCDLDTRFAEDGLRDTKDTLLRQNMHARYEHELYTNHSAPYIKVSGSPNERAAQACGVINLLLDQKFDDGITVPLLGGSFKVEEQDLEERTG